MPGNRRVFVSHAHADNDRCVPLLAAMDAWSVDYWFDTQELNPGQQLTDRIQQALTERDIFIRVCTPAAMQSYWMGQEVLAYRGLQEQDRGRGTMRQIVYLILDQGYVREPTADSDIVIDAATRPQSVWMGELRKALDVAKIARSMNRRAFLGLSVAGVATVASVGTAAAVLVRGSGLRSAAAGVVPTAHQPTATPLAGQQRLLWSFTDSGSQPSLALGTSALYANTGDGLYALDLRTGNRLWFNASIQTITTDNRPLLVGDTLYCVGSSGLSPAFSAVKASDGSPVWSAQFSPLLPSTPVADDTALYVYSDDGLVTAFERSTGTQRWQTKIATSPLSPFGLAVSSGFVFGVSDDQNLYALRASDGSVANKVNTNAHSASQPIATSDMVYFLAGDGNVYALNAADQSLRWKTSTGLDFVEIAGAPVLADGTLYVCTGNGNVVSLDAASGTLHWSVPQRYAPNDSGNFQVANTPALDANALYVPVQRSNFTTNVTYSFLLAVSRSDGHELWRFGVPTVGYGNFASPVVGNGAVYFGGVEHTIYAVSTTGA